MEVYRDGTEERSRGALGLIHDVINTTTGRVSNLKYIINTRDFPPLGTAPYWLVESWMDQLQMEVKHCQKQGSSVHL